MVFAMEPPADGAAPVSPGAECARIACQVVVTGVTTRLGSRIVVLVNEVAPSGTILHGVQATGISMDDLEDVLPRLARGLATHGSYEQTRTPDTVTQRETFAPAKMKSVSVPSLRASLLMFSAGGSFATAVEGLADVRFERGRPFANFAVGVVLPAGSEGDSPLYGGLTSELGGGLYLTDGDTAPYVAGAVTPKIVGLSLASSSPPPGMSDSSSGGSASLGLMAKVGLMMMRASTTRLVVECSVEQQVTELAGTFPTFFRLTGGLAF
jgi:hypothetical protein